MLGEVIEGDRRSSQWAQVQGTIEEEFDEESRRVRGVIKGSSRKT